MTKLLPRDVTTHKRRKPRSVVKFNVKMMQKLQKALQADPSADLSLILPGDYAWRRTEMILEEKGYEHQVDSEQVAPRSASESAVVFPESALPQAVTEVIYELSVDAKATLQLDNTKECESLTEALGSLLRRSILVCSLNSETHLFRCNSGLVVKCFVPEQTAKGKDFTQYTSIQYLESQIPEIPAPRARGLLLSGRMAYMWMTHIPGETLEEAWPRLTNDQKGGLREDLEGILNRMRSHVNHSGIVLGGVQGEGCKDTRRNTRISSKPCLSATDFHGFVYGSTTNATPMYVQSVQLWTPAPPEQQRIVFTHGDLRPANIHVVNHDGRYSVSGLLDWEMSGFYPEWWEACKITNCMSPIDTWDWYRYLPTCVSPAKYPYQWLNDQFWDRYLLGHSGLVNAE